MHSTNIHCMTVQLGHSLPADIHAVNIFEPVNIHAVYIFCTCEYKITGYNLKVVLFLLVVKNILYYF